MRKVFFLLGIAVKCKMFNSCVFRQISLHYAFGMVNIIDAFKKRNHLPRKILHTLLDLLKLLLHRCAELMRRLELSARLVHQQRDLMKRVPCVVVDCVYHQARSKTLWATRVFKPRCWISHINYIRFGVRNHASSTLIDNAFSHLQNAQSLSIASFNTVRASRKMTEVQRPAKLLPARQLMIR